MASFSQRMGYTSVKSIIQVDSIDRELRNGLWNVLHKHIWSVIKVGTYGGIESRFGNEYLNTLWENFFKNPLHKKPYSWNSILSYIENYYFNSEWYELYDFIEFTAKALKKEAFIQSINDVLKTELSAYRFVGFELIKITSDEEVEEIEQAMKIEAVTHYATTHLKEALKLMANKQNPDYRNSIKESISAVEAICTAITEANGNSTSTLGAALKVIEKESHIELHPALKQAFDKLYGYTSDDGIRHFIKSDKEVYFEDAKFMLVSCSAFVNYLSEKASKSGVEL